MKTVLWVMVGLLLSCSVVAQKRTTFQPAKEWPDTEGKHINAHGGGILKKGKVYYWYGENRPDAGGSMNTGISVYTSRDLMNWENRGIALSVSSDTLSPIQAGCIMERPKVVYNRKTGKYVMLFHLELKGQGYAAAQVGFAVADQPEGPFRFLRGLRPNAGLWPVDFSKNDIEEACALDPVRYSNWWTPEWREAVKKGLFLARDLKGGQMSRDMTVYVDDITLSTHGHIGNWVIKYINNALKRHGLFLKKAKTKRYGFRHSVITGVHTAQSRKMSAPFSVGHSVITTIRGKNLAQMSITELQSIVSKISYIQQFTPEKMVVIKNKAIRQIKKLQKAKGG